MTVHNRRAGRRFVLAFLFLLFLGLASAQTSDKDRALASIVDRANDKEHPESNALFEKEFNDWAAQFRVRIKSTVMPVGSPVRAAATVCQEEVKDKETTCRLRGAQLVRGKLHCYYTCE
jgi:hypothetical protein